MDYSHIPNNHSNENSNQTMQNNEEKIYLVMDSKLDKIQEEERRAREAIATAEIER